MWMGNPKTPAGLDPTNWNPEGATIGVWSSEHSYPGEMIEMALRKIRFMRASKKRKQKTPSSFCRKMKCAPAKIVRKSSKAHSGVGVRNGSFE